MPNLRLLGPAVCAAVCAFAAEAPLPELRTEPKTAGSIFFVRNTSSQPLTAFLIELVDYPGSSYSYWQDEPGEIVAPGATKEIQVANMTVGAVPDYVKVRAAVYADGATAGVPEKIELLLGRRRATLETMRELIRRIEKAGGAAAAKADLTAWSEGMPAVSRARRESAAGVNQAAAKALIADTVKRLDAEEPAAVVARLRAAERALAASKPVL